MDVFFAVDVDVFVLCDISFSFASYLMQLKILGTTLLSYHFAFTFTFNATAVTCWWVCACDSVFNSFHLICFVAMHLCTDIEMWTAALDDLQSYGRFIKVMPEDWASFLVMNRLLRSKRHHVYYLAKINFYWSETNIHGHKLIASLFVANYEMNQLTFRSQQSVDVVEPSRAEPSQC